nr:HRDC domain-containing protein [Angustibacter aerolatus]
MRCRGCGTVLSTGAQRKVGRCDDCPPTYDEGTFERLRAWRLAVSTAASVPAFVVFTDATLVALAEQQPTDDAGLAKVPGIGATKRERYGAQVLALLGGAEVADVLEPAAASLVDRTRLRALSRPVRPSVGSCSGNTREKALCALVGLPYRWRVAPRGTPPGVPQPVRERR